MTDRSVPEGEMVRQVGYWLAPDGPLRYLLFVADYVSFDVAVARFGSSAIMRLFVSDAGWFYLIGQGRCHRYASGEAATLAWRIMQ